MKLLLVGANAAVASVLLPRLQAVGDVICAAREGHAMRLNLSDWNAPLTLPTDLDVVINVAAYLHERTAEDQIQAQAVNVLGLLRLAQAAHAAGAKKLIQISSIYATLANEAPRFGAYALSKRHGDEVLQLFSASHGLPILCVRPGPLYGVGDAFRKNQPFLYDLIDKARTHREITLYGRHDALRNFLHAQDLADLLVAAIQRDIRGTFACTHPENIPMSQIAQAAVAAFDSRSTIVRLMDKPDVPDIAFPYDASFAQACGLAPQISIAEGMRMEAAHRRQAA